MVKRKQASYEVRNPRYFGYAQFWNPMTLFTLRFEKTGCDLLGGYGNVKIDGSGSLKTNTREKDCPLQCDGTQTQYHPL